METTIENNNSQMRKGVLELCILAVLHGNEAYPSDVLEQLRKANMNMPEGTLYPILTRLKNAGYLNYRWVESNEGPPRKYFLLTNEGQVFLQKLEQDWKELMQSVNTLIENKK